MKDWKGLLGILLIFVLGAISGAFVWDAISKRELNRLLDNGYDGFRELTVQRLSGQLSLDQQQTENLAVIMANNSTRIREARKDSFPQVKVSIEQTESEIKSILTPAQRVKFEPIAAKGRDRLSKYPQPAPDPAPAAPPASAP